MAETLDALIRTSDVVRVSPCDVPTSGGLRPGLAIAVRSGAIVVIERSALRLIDDLAGREGVRYAIDRRLPGEPVTIDGTVRRISSSPIE